MYRLFGGRRANVNATNNGTAVNASATLCKVSPSNATDPDTTTTPACNNAVTPRPTMLIISARRPAALDSSAYQSDRNIMGMTANHLRRRMTKTPSQPVV